MAFWALIRIYESFWALASKSEILLIVFNLKISCVGYIGTVQNQNLMPTFQRSSLSVILVLIILWGFRKFKFQPLSKMDSYLSNVNCLCFKTKVFDYLCKNGFTVDQQFVVLCKKELLLLNKGIDLRFKNYLGYPNTIFPGSCPTKWWISFCLTLGLVQQQVFGP